MTREQATQVFDALDAQHPAADTELHFTNPFELLVATILSAQSTDQRVNLVTPTLFARFPTAESMAQATPEELEPLIHATGFFRAKSRSLIGMARMLLAEHGAKVPAEMDALTKLPGVGRKTANVVLGHALGVPGFPVDRHVLRVSNRIGLAEGDDAVKVEAQLTAQLPPERWTRGSDALILHGRRICRPVPLCSQCEVQPWCLYYRTVVSQADREVPTKRGSQAKPAHSGSGRNEMGSDRRVRSATTGRRASKAARPTSGARSGSVRSSARRPAGRPPSGGGARKRQK